ncbi:hypothetical protein B0H13DRAFT_1081849 [Mycena leptocephala]|nr:hypothetical protein B0H13DRAFT_1081849 [Mycena leptocephala]
MNRGDSEEDGMDQCIVPSDGEDMMILDNELRRFLVSPLPSGVQLVAVLDTTHSSSLLDLQHYRCNRVFVPWIEKGRRYSNDRWNSVFRRHALPMLPTYSTQISPTHTLSTQISPTHRPPTQISPTRTLPTRISPTHPLPLSSTPRRSISITQPLPSSDVRQQGLGEVKERSTSISSWLLSVKERCESPVAIYPCTGWCCTYDDGDTTDDTVRADVISLASCSEPHRIFEDDDQTMTSSLAEFLREDPRKSLRDVILHVSHVSYSVAFKRHVEASQRKRKAPVDTLVHFVARLERETRSTGSLHNNASASTTSPNMQTKSGAVPEWMNNQIAWLKQKLKEVRENPGYYNLDDFRTPELSSLRPLDLNREWGM